MAVPDRNLPGDTSRDDRDRPSFLNRMVSALADEDERENEDLGHALGADVGTQAASQKTESPEK
jgi:hypothetical protein